MTKQSRKRIIDIPAGTQARAWSMRYIVEQAAAAATETGSVLASGLSESAEIFSMVAENAITGKKPMRVETKANGKARVLSVGRPSTTTITSGERQKVTLSRSDYNAMIDRLDELEGLEAIALRRGDDSFPTSVARRIVSGENPIKVYREVRTLTQLQLAHKSGVTQSYLAAIEKGHKPGSASALKKIADVLAVPMEVLVADD